MNIMQHIKEIILERIEEYNLTKEQKGKLREIHSKCRNI